MSDYTDLLAKAEAYKTTDALAAHLLLNLAAALRGTESERKHHENTAGCLRTDLEYMTRERDEARAIVAEANNSLFGSQAYFTSLDGTESDKWHLSRAIEKLKESDAEARAKLAEYERWQGEAEKLVRDTELRNLNKNGARTPKGLKEILQFAFTAAHARGYAAGVAQEREECAKVAEPKDKRPCDCTRCSCDNIDDARAVAAWDDGAYTAAAIRNRSGQ